MRRSIAALALLLVVAAGLAAAEPINRMCPVLTDEPVDPAYIVTWHGQAVGLCCARCVRQFTADPGKYAGNLPATTSAPRDPGHVDHPAAETALAPAAAAPATDPHADHGDHAPTGGEAALDHAGMHQLNAEAPRVPRIVAWLGRFHPVIVHFPIALSVLAAVAAIIGRIRASEPFRQTARIAIHGAALTAIPVILLGWFSAAADSHPGLDAVLAWHRWLGTAAGAALIAVSVATELAHRRPGAARWMVFGLVGSVGLALVLGVVGHLGGILVFGPDHFALAL